MPCSRSAAQIDRHTDRSHRTVSQGRMKSRGRDIYALFGDQDRLQPQRQDLARIVDRQTFGDIHACGWLERGHYAVVPPEGPGIVSAPEAPGQGPAGVDVAGRRIRAEERGLAVFPCDGDVSPISSPGADIFQITDDDARGIDPRDAHQNMAMR